MIVYRTRTDLVKHLDLFRSQEKSIGLVPTMGALHSGHASLVEKAREENDVVVVSIFVNPTQFNDPEDLANYPRTLDQDLEMLRDLQADLVFVPSVNEMYPAESDERVFDLGGLDRVLEGKQRPGHFQGVVQIVSKLLEITVPRRAYFGQKDFQQLVIIRRLVDLLGMDVEIMTCPIVREPDGLAMSSRNVRLSREERKAAPFIYNTLVQVREMGHSLPPGQLRAWVESQFRDQEMMRFEYFEIVEDKELRLVRDWKEKVNKVAVIAVQLGGVRLIDNLIFD